MAGVEVAMGVTCCLGMTFLVFWTFFSIVGGIYYSNWSPKFDLEDVHIRYLNVTAAQELSYDMDVLITVRHFSGLRRIEQFSYELRTLHAGKRIGSSSVPGFHPIANKTMGITSTQTVKLLPLGPQMGDSMRADLNSSGRVAMRVYIRGQIYTPLFLAMKKRGTWNCDLIVNPSLPFGSQIYDRLCCKKNRCLEWQSSGESVSCSSQAPNCCLLPPSSISSTISVCG